MKFNFRKIASVIASAVMLGSTVGTALAANYPAPFVVSGTADAAVVITSGSHAGAVSDWDAAVSLQSALQGLVTTTTTTTGVSTTGGDSFKIEKSSDKLNLNNNLSTVWGTKVTDSNLAVLLKKGTYRSKDNIDYSYEQYIDFVAGVEEKHFMDNDYKSRTPSLGISIARSSPVLNYTLDFTKYPRSTVDSNGRLDDLEDRDITILGVTYKLLNAYNASTSTKFELMAGAVSDWVNMNEEKTEAVGSSTYKVKLDSISTESSVNYAQFTVTDSAGTVGTTTKLAKGGTYKLGDGTQIGVTDITYQNFAGGVMNAEFTLGANKMTIENGQSLQLDDSSVNDIKTYIERSEVTGGKVDIKKIKFAWITQDKKFITDESSLTMPGLNSIKFTAGNFSFPVEETTKVRPSGSYRIDLTVPIKDGEYTLPILYGNTTAFTSIGDGTYNLSTADVTELIYDRDLNRYFVASWNSSTDAQTYILDISSITQDSNYINYTTVQNVITKDEYKSKKPGDTITLGNVELTVNTLHYANSVVNFSINAGGSFHRVYTKGGMEIFLPYVTTSGGKGSFNASVAPTTFTLWMAEENKDGTLGQIHFNASLGHASDKAEVRAVYSDKWSAGETKQIGTSDNYEGYIGSDLATKIIYYQPSGSQDYADVIYHGSESYANVFLTALGVSVSGGEVVSGGGGNVLVVKDTEVDTVKDRNLVVVGGSCINTVARKIVDAAASAPICGADFTAKTNVDAGKYLIKAVASPYNTAKTAVLVAGYEAAETKLAVAKLKESHATDVDTSKIYPETTA